MFISCTACARKIHSITRISIPFVTIKSEGVCSIKAGLKIHLNLFELIFFQFIFFELNKCICFFLPRKISLKLRVKNGMQCHQLVQSSGVCAALGGNPLDLS